MIEKSSNNFVCCNSGCLKKEIRIGDQMDDRGNGMIYHPECAPPNSISGYSRRREEILEKAKEAVLKNRNVDYGDPEDNFKTIANLWNAYCGPLDGEHIPLESHDVAIFCILIKIARIAESPKKIDHWVDIAGYAACGGECTTSNKGSKQKEEEIDSVEMYDLISDSNGYLYRLPINSKMPDGHNLIEKAPLSRQYWALPRYGIDVQVESKK